LVTKHAIDAAPCFPTPVADRAILLKRWRI
jgi:hypothetical protein